MADVAICSLVRDGMAYLPGYRRQLESLVLPEGLTWSAYVLEGDSRDDSHAFLEGWAREDPRVHVGREDVGEATVAEDRAARWARAGNACFDLVPPDGDHTHVLWLEADLCFPQELLARLLAHEVDVVAPIIWLGGFFYDTWGFRGLDGERWTNEAPYHADFRAMRLVELNSVGSCVLFERKVLDAGIRFRPTYEDGLLVGMCNDARARGWRVWADTSTAILHPVSNWEAQMWRCDSIEIEQADGRARDSSEVDPRRAGLRAFLTLLDAEIFVRDQQRFLLRMCEQLRTNRLALELHARTYPRKTYALRVRRRPPEEGRTGLRARLGWKQRNGPTCVRLEGSACESSDSAPFRPSDPTCTIRITMEESS